MTENRPLAPAEAFDLIGDETRMTVLRALAEAPYEEYGGELTFSELRQRAGIRDSGKFNYHLQQLVGRFVRETDDGYSLSYAGDLLYRTVVAGFFTDEPALDAFETGDTCRNCGTPLRARYEDSRLRVECPDCEREYQDVPFPPSGIGLRSGEELLRAFDQWCRHNLLLFNRDICKWCAGPMPGTFERQTRTGLTGDREEAVYVARSCEHCEGYMLTTPGESVLYRPEVVSFFHERGVDVTTRPLWTLDFAADGVSAVRSADPWEVEVTVACAGDRLRLVLDDDVEVVETELRCDAA